MRGLGRVVRVLAPALVAPALAMLAGQLSAPVQHAAAEPAAQPTAEPAAQPTAQSEEPADQGGQPEEESAAPAEQAAQPDASSAAADPPPPGPQPRPAGAAAGAPAAQATTQPATAPGARPTTQPSTRSSTQPTTQASLNFKDSPLDPVLDYLSEVAGYVIIREVPLDGRATVMSKRPVNPDEALAVLRTVLASNGLTVVQEDRVLRIVSKEKAKKANLPVHIGNDPAAVEGNDELITQVIPILNMDAGKLKQDLTPLIGQEADVTANEASNSIVITDAAANIRRVLRIIQALDQRDTASSDLKIVQLKYAPAAATAKLLTSIFQSVGGGGAQMSPQQMEMMQRMGGQPGGGQPQGGGGGAREGRIPGNAIEQALHGGHVNAVADERTNSLIITAPTETLKVIDTILKQLDSNPEPAMELKAISLRFADAEATAKLLNSTFKSDSGQNSGMMRYYFGFSPSSEGSGAKINVTADERTNSLIVSAPAEVMRQVETLVKDLDANPAATAEIRTFTLQHADAFDAALLVKSIFAPEKEQDNPLRYFIFGGGGSDQKAKGPKVTATSDDRTNTLIVTAPTEVMKAIKDLIDKLDVNPTAEDTLFIYRLKNAQSSNLELVLNVLFGNVSGNQQQNNQQNRQQQDQLQQQQQQGQFARSNVSPNSPGAQGNGLTGRNRRNNRNNPANPNGRQRLSPGAASAVSELTGKVFVVAEPDTNALLVTTAVKYEKQVRAIIEELDRPAPQVLIKVLIAEVTHDSSDDLGADFSVLNTRKSGNGTSLAQNLGNAAAATATGGLVVAVTEQNVTATLHALAASNKLDVLSRPYILASDNQDAEIIVGDEVPFIQDTRLTETGQSINTIFYKDIGIILDVTPHINPDGQVILDVAPEISAQTGQGTPITQGVTAPVFSKRSAYSRVGIADGQTIVIGGLMQDQKTETITKVPFLGDLPLVGAAFTRRQDTKTKTELLIFLTPHVAQQPAALKPMSQDEIRGTRLTPNAVDPGVFREHMRGLRRGGPETDGPPATRPAAVYPGLPAAPPQPSTPAQPPAPALPTTVPVPPAPPSPAPAGESATQSAERR